nr:killer cell lectin-like receptor subfamily F member 2 isoform X2 [Columba livia]
MWKGDNKARNIGKTPQDPQVVPIAVPIPIALSLPHPVPITFLYCFSCFSPITKGHFSSTGRVHIPQKCTWKGSKGRKSLKCPKAGARARCPQPCPSPRGAQGLKQRSHSSSAAGASAPAGWQPFAAKCYWVSTKTSTWEEAAENCGYQRSQLVVLESAEEKAFIGEMTRTSSGAWMGLSIDQTRGQEWSWWDGSALQAALSPVLGPVQAKACAAIRGGQLRSHICSAPLQWVCQKKATEI